MDEDDSKMKVGMRCEEAGRLLDHFRQLPPYYYGTMSPDQVTSIRQTVADKAQLDGPFATPADVYTASAESAYANRPLRLTDCHKASTS